MSSGKKISSKQIENGSNGEVIRESFKQIDKCPETRKKISIPIPQSGKLIENIKRRISIMSNLGQKNNITKYNKEIKTEGNSIFFTMELCNYNIIEHLKKIKPKGKGLDIGEIYEAFSQLNNAFEIMRQKIVNFGNIKLENILVNTKGDEFIFKLSGFEIIPELVQFAKEKNPEIICQYLPPELLINNSTFKIEDSTDLWTIGVIIYYLFFREFPFQGKSCEDVLKEINNKEIKKTNFSDLDDLINGLLNKDKTKRFTWNDYLNHKFFKGDGYWMKYKAFTKIGEGPFSTVYKAYNKEKGIYDAIKIIDFGKINELEKNEEKQNEIKKDLVKRIDDLMKLYEGNHDAIIEIYKKFEIKNGIAYSMELYDMNLKYYINTTFSHPKASNIFYALIEINRCLKYFTKDKENAKSVSNLKLENILLKKKSKNSKEYIFKLSDVGFYQKIFEVLKNIKDIKDLAQKTSIPDDIPCYIPPEFNNEVKNETQSDLWNLGIIIYFFRFKTFPYYEKSFQDIISKINSEVPKLDACENEKLKSLIEKLLQKEPKNRLSWDEYFNHEFFINRQYSEYYDIIGNPIAESAYYNIYLGKSKKNKEERVLKIVNKNHIRENYLNEFGRNLDENLLKSLFKLLGKQTEIMKTLENNEKNDNTVKFYEYFNNQNEFTIVMEKCDYDLNHYFIEKRKDNFSLEEIKDLLIQLNNTFKLMDENKIIHGDLKLENILIKRENGKLIYKLTDYGMNKEFLKLSENLLELNGAPEYLAPEILGGENDYTKSDLWSLGVIIYNLLFREFPYTGDDEDDVLSKINLNRTKNLKHIPEDNQLDHLLRMLLTINKEDRITWDEYFKHPFFAGGDCWIFYSEKEIIGKRQHYYKIYKVKSERKPNEYKAVKSIDLNKIRKEISKKKLKPCTDEDLKIYIDDLIQETENMELMRGPNRDNKNTVIFYDYFQTKDEFCIVQELCAGSLVNIFKEKGQFNSQEIFDVLNQLNNSFRIMKDNNLSHKDLRLEKILYKKDNNNNYIYKLTGLEFNKRIDRLLQGLVRTNNIYKSPEILSKEIDKVQEKDKAYFYQKADIWSLGVIIYYLYFGEFPFEGVSKNDVQSSIKKNEIRINEIDDPDLKDLLNKMLTKDKVERIDWDGYFSHSFFSSNK